VAEATLDITDELLVAYVDDELDADQRDMVSTTLDRDPALRRRAEEMRLSRDLIREAFPLQPPDTVPMRIDAAANRLAEACAPHSRHAGRGLPFRPSHAIAAGLGVLAVTTAGFFAWQPAEPKRERVTALAQIDPDNPLHALLESTPSAQVVHVAPEDAVLRAILTFRAKDGRFCREFEILASAGASSGVACRAYDGQWRTEVLLGTAAAPPSSQYYTPAAGVDDPGIAAAVDDLMQDEPLSAEEEAQVLASSWRTGAP
jgi:hypothetical protein